MFEKYNFTLSHTRSAFFRAPPDTIYLQRDSWKGTILAFPHYAQLRLNLLQPHGLSPSRLLLSVGFLGKHTGAGCHFLLEEIFPTQGWNPCLLCLLHWRQILNHWVTWEALLILYISRRKIDLGSDAHAYFLFPGRKRTSPESEHAQKSQHLRKEALYLFKGATKSPLLADK